jgi:hypothetical protein
VPDELFRATAPLLFELACHAPAPHASAAASLLSEGFMSSGADRWVALSSCVYQFMLAIFEIDNTSSDNTIHSSLCMYSQIFCFFFICAALTRVLL